MIITVAAGPYAHLSSLAHDDIPADGIGIRYEVLEPGVIFRRMLSDATWDIAEMSLATAYMLADRGDTRFVALPIFPSRAFRHSALYVPKDSPVRSAKDLLGARIGVLRYAMTTAVWIREILARQYGVPAGSLQWFVGEDSPHPDAIRPTIVDGASGLERMSLSGALDCLISGRTPGAFEAGHLRRLFPDFAREERTYFAETRVFPIMHVMIARRSIIEKLPDLLPTLMRRFLKAKTVAEEGLLNFDVSIYPLPWLPAYVEQARKLFAGDLWPYGVEANRGTLNAFAKAMASEGLTRRELAPEEVFADA